MDSSAEKQKEQFRILVIEDDYANRLFFCEYLSFCGFDVYSLANGLDIEYQLKTIQPHLLVLDIGLPEIDGYALLRIIRGSKQWQTLPIVVVSGYAFEGDRQKALSLGAQRYLVKPVRLRELSTTVKSILPVE